MNVWTYVKWKNYYEVGEHRCGVRVDYERGVEPEVKRAIKEFISWLRSEYAFPKRVRIYVRAKRRIKTEDGDMVCGSFFRTHNRDDEPYIRIATGDYQELVQMRGKDNALAAILWTVAHELTHYFQWLNDSNLTIRGLERQATNYARKILADYAQTRDHP